MVSGAEERAETHSVCRHSARNGLYVSRSCIFYTDVIRRLDERSM